MEQNSWKVDISSGGHKIRCSLWTAKVHSSFHKSIPIFHIVNEVNAVQAMPSHLWFILNFFHLLLGIPSGHFPLGFSTKILSLFSHTCHLPCSSSFIWWPECRRHLLIKQLVFYLFQFVTPFWSEIFRTQQKGCQRAK